MAFISKQILHVLSVFEAFLGLLLLLLAIWAPVAYLCVLGPHARKVALSVVLGGFVEPILLVAFPSRVSCLGLLILLLLLFIPFVLLYLILVLLKVVVVLSQDVV